MNFQSTIEQNDELVINEDQVILLILLFPFFVLNIFFACTWSCLVQVGNITVKPLFPI